MNVRRVWAARAAVALAGAALLSAGTGCRKHQTGEVVPIAPSFAVNQSRAPLGSPIEVTYTWTVDPGAKKLSEDYRAFVHFLDSHSQMIFEDDHVPVPPPSQWEAGKTYTYTRTK